MRQEITDSVIAQLHVNEAGANFLARFPHYMTYLAEEADLVIYTTSLAMDAEVSQRPAADYINGLKSTVSLARQAFDE